MHYATLTLSGTYRETAPLVKGLRPGTSGPELRFDRFLAQAESIRSSRRIQRVLVHVKQDFRCRLYAGVEAIYREIAGLRDAGKEIIFFAPNYGTKEMYLSSPAVERYIHPLGSFRFPGLHYSSLFLGRALRNLQIEWYIARRGHFKTSPDRLSRVDMAEADREQYGHYLDVMMEEVTETVKEAFSLESEDISALLGGATFSPDEAVARMWLTGAATFGELQDRFKKAKMKSRRVRTRRTIGRGKKVAVLVFEGSIIDGQSRYSPLTGQSIGPDSYLPVIRRLKADKSVRAVIFRVNSGGGSATASEDVLQELSSLAEKKPLITSFSEMAASGGYWIACKSERIFAEKTTLTGSIGVFSIALHAERLLKRLGISASSLRRGETADAGSIFRAPSEVERQHIEQEVERVYEAFLERSASARRKSVEDIDKIGSGHVWSGKDGVENGLVDEIGGIREAAAYVKSRLGLRRISLLYYPRIKYSWIERLIYGNFGRQVMAESGMAPLSPDALYREASFLQLRPLALAPCALLPDLFDTGATQL